jgi:hypothetical protein
MPRIVKRSASQAVKTGPSRGVPLSLFVPPQLSQLVGKPAADSRRLRSPTMKV